MIRLRSDDFDTESDLAPLARVAGLAPSAFREQFGYLVKGESEPLRLVRT